MKGLTQFCSKHFWVKCCHFPYDPQNPTPTRCKSLGAPKQEKWMGEHKGRIKAVQLGVGAAFDFIIGRVKQAPVWMQKAYLEWLYRMPQQPKKTAYRMSLVPSFLFRTLLQFINNGRRKF